MHRLRCAWRRRFVGALLALSLPLQLALPPARALDDSLYERQWGLAAIGAKAAWDRGLLGAGVEIAIVDTGVHVRHQDLDANVRTGLNLFDGRAPAQDDNGHGTHVAGIAAASIDDGGSVGVAPRAGIVPVKGLDRDGAGDVTALAGGIRWAADAGAEVINLSFGPELSILRPAPGDLIDAIRYAWSKGAIPVIAAGNDFIGQADFGDVPAIVVSATTRSDRSADFSNGVGNARWAIAAPGGGNTLDDPAVADIWSTVWASDDQVDTYAALRGTSMAVPFVSGAAALLRGAGLGPQETVDRLLATARDLGLAGRDSTYGSGLLDVAKATEGLAPAVVTPPPVSSTPPAKPAPSVVLEAPPTTRPPRRPPPTSVRPAPAEVASPASTQPTPPSQQEESLPPQASAGGAAEASDPPTGSDGATGAPAALDAAATAALLGVVVAAVRASRRGGDLSGLR